MPEWNIMGREIFGAGEESNPTLQERKWKYMYYVYGNQGFSHSFQRTLSAAAEKLSVPFHLHPETPEARILWSM